MHKCLIWVCLSKLKSCLQHIIQLLRHTWHIYYVKLAFKIWLMYACLLVELDSMSRKLHPNSINRDLTWYRVRIDIWSCHTILYMAMYFTIFILLSAYMINLKSSSIYEGYNISCNWFLILICYEISSWHGLYCIFICCTSPL